MRKFYFIPALGLIASLLVVLIQGNQDNNVRLKLSKQERIEGAIEYARLTSSDVETGEIPYDKLFAAIKEGQRRLQAPTRNRSNPNSLLNVVWRERGPNDRGGRTRAIMIDERDPNRNRIWTGGVSGGLWRTEDITQDDPQWEKLGIYFESLAISDIAQDPNDHDVILVSTGESYTGDVQGAGIFRSTDDGATWTLLPSTANSIMRTINEIYIHTNGDIYAATAVGGLVRSPDDGENWEKVAGSGLNGSNSNNIHDFYFVESNQTFYISSDNSIYKSTTGDRADWTNIGTGKPGFPSNLDRIEFAVCPDNPEVLYCIGAVGSFSSPTYVTTDGGENWISRSEPAIFFGYGQAWYDLEIAEDPFGCNRLLSGGVGMAESTFQGLTWRPIAEEMHVDHHNITFDPKNSGRVLFGNDGGIWLSENGGVSVEDKSFGFVTTQFYACAIHPDAGSPYAMGGTQDNNSLILEEAGLSTSRIAKGGDGVFCFIDQNEPNIQIVSSQNGNYDLSTNGGFSFGLGANIDGEFINRSGYDNDANILYGQVNQSGVSDVDFFRWSINTGQVEIVDISNRNINVSAVLADPSEPNRVYLGGGSGVVVRVDNAHQGTSVTGTVFADLPGSAEVSCIYMDKQTSDHALISLFRFGAGLHNIWVTYNAGANWTSIEGDLPDLPVRWCMFDPADHDRAMIATDAGVWTTDDIDGDFTHWEPTNPDNGMPFVRVDMLRLRESDKVVLAATYGRGLMATDVFSAPAAVIVTQPIAYVGQPVPIDGSQSVNATSFQWDLGDNTTSNEQIISHAYDMPGTYTISLTINGSLTKTQQISILPYLPSPYQVGETNYAGDFESQPEHFAAYTPNGTKFQRGVSDKPGKDGTNSGANAWVLGINDNLYQNNTRSELYTPMYDMTEQGLYEFRFFGKYAVQSRNDGFQIEYSTNGGASWTQLGNTGSPNWYNYFNENITNGAFPQGKSYFTHAQLNWKQYIKDVSFLAGQANVSFRFVFRSDGEEPAQGVAIDDVELTKYDGELKTTLTVFNASYTGEQEITLNWTTGIEYQCKEFVLEQSTTGFGFEEDISPITPAKNGVSAFATEYSRTDQNLHDVIFYRLKVVNENPSLDYAYTFYSDTIVVLRDAEPDVVHIIAPNPFTDRIGVSFSSVVDREVNFRLFDVSGKLILEEKAIPNAVSYTIDQLSLPQGIYILSVKIGDGEEKAFTLLSYVEE